MKLIAIIAAVSGAGVLAVLAAAGTQAAADGWRAGFLLLSAPPLGAVALLLIARVVGADWDAALRPLLPAVPWVALLWVPVAIGQGLFHQPFGHLHLWLSPPAFALRSLLALAVWTWIARGLARDTVRQAGPLLFAHALIVSVMGYDWLLGVAPAQPESAAPMVLATMQIAGACAVACAAGLGTPAIRRDLAYLLVAAALGLAYLLYIDFVVLWFGDLPDHVGWYVDRQAVPAIALPGLGLAFGLLAILLVGIGRNDVARAWAGRGALVALAMVMAWIVGGAGGWIALLAATATIVAIGPIAREAVG